VNLRLIAVGKIREPYVAAAVADFRARLERYGGFEEREVAASSGRDPARAMREESARILAALVPGEPFWLLDRAGTSLTSIELSDRLQRVAHDDGATRLTLAIGGAFGVDSALVARADFVWSLSSLTFLHEWARAIVVEQLYRATKIARNEPYHH